MSFFLFPVQLERIETYAELEDIAREKFSIRVGSTKDIKGRASSYRTQGYSGTMFWTETKNMCYAENKLLKLGSYKHNKQKTSNNTTEPGQVYVIQGKKFN